MSEFAIQRRVAKMILEEKPSMTAGVKLLFGELDKKYPKHGWKKCETLAWEKLLSEWVEWLDVLVKEHKPPLVRLVWFETPESLNDTMTSVSGWKEIGRKDEAWGADEDRVWPINEEGNTVERGLFMMPLVDEAMELGGWGDKCEDDAVQAAVHAVVYGVNLLLVLNGLPQSVLGKEQREPLGLTCGWASGDCDVVGGWVDGKWGKLPRATLAKKPTEPPDDRMAESYPLQYLQSGGDLNWRGEANGETLLFRAWLADIGEVREILQRGVSAKAKNDSGDDCLRKFGAAKIDILNLLIEYGADPRSESFRKSVLHDGRCTVEHLELLEKYGCKGDEIDVLRDIATSNCYHRTRDKALEQQLRFWLARGKSIHGTPQSLEPPIWSALKAHADELVEHRDWLTREKDNPGRWDYWHDRIAIMFLKYGANPNAVWNGEAHPLIPSGATPLMVQRYDDTSLIKALLKHGADPNARCARGRTALDYAKDAAGHLQVIGNEAAAKCVAILEKVTKA